MEVKNLICPGCGQVMQDKDPNQSNYVLSLDFKLCMRCFRWKHYKDIPLLVKPIINIENQQALTLPEYEEMLVVIDSMFVKETLLPLIPWIQTAKKVSIVATKLDLFPKQVTPNLIHEEVLRHLGKNVEYIDAIYVTSSAIPHTIDALRDYVLTKVKNYRFLLLGMINAGKSSLLNSLLSENEITTSLFPQTTLDPIITTLEHVVLIDTPGLTNPQHLFYYLDPTMYQKTVIQKRVHPRVFQSAGKSSILVDGLFNIHIDSRDKISISLYVSEALDVKRVKSKESLDDTLIDPPFKQTILSPKKEGFDFLIEGIGKCHIVGEATSLVISHHKKLTISKSKGTLVW